MDPVSQGVVGGVAGRQFAAYKEKWVAVVIAGLAGMAADLDVLINSSDDPLLFLEYHRHFTHALVFIPLGALMCALVFQFVFRHWFRRLSLGFKRVYLFCFAGYATHALLDACTTYGTQLFWPFSDVRVAWNTVSVIDPLFTLPTLFLLICAVRKQSRVWPVMSLCYVIAYLGLGLIQHDRALEAAQRLADQRGHRVSTVGVKPSFANLLVWKSVYEYQDRYFVDAVRVGRNEKYYSGVSVQKLHLDEHFPWLQAQSQQAKDVERFRWFSNKHLALDPNNEHRIIDVRYSLVPNQVTGMWGIELDKNKAVTEHVVWSTNRPKGSEAWLAIQPLWQMILGR